MRYGELEEMFYKVDKELDIDEEQGDPDICDMCGCEICRCV